MAVVLVGLKPHSWLHGVIVGPKKDEGVELSAHIGCLEASGGGGGAHLLFDNKTIQLGRSLEI